MSVARKSPATITTYDPVSRWAARAWALVAYLAVLAAVAGIVVFAVRYQPVSAANFASEPVAESARNMIRINYTSGGTFSFGFLITNDGPVPLKIQRIHVSGQNDLLITTRLETAAKRDAGTLVLGEPLEKFLPFTLSGGEQRWIVVRTRFGNCHRFRAGDSETFTRLEVTYTVLGFTKHAWVSLPKDVKVISPPDSACPVRAA